MREVYVPSVVIKRIMHKKLNLKNKVSHHVKKSRIEIDVYTATQWLVPAADKKILSPLPPRMENTISFKRGWDSGVENASPFCPRQN